MNILDRIFALMYLKLSNFIIIVKTKSANISSETLGWVSNIVLHSATLPALMALMTGLSDKTPPIDMVLLVWFGLVLLFIRAALRRDMLNLVTIGVGFVLQAVAMALIFFK